MLKLYITNVLTDGLLYYEKLNVNIKQRIDLNKDIHKKLQMITTELLLKFALKDIGYKEEINLKYTPKPILLNSNLNISKSHSHNYVMVALSNSNVGCDIEKVRNVKNPGKLLTTDELEIYNKSKNKEETFTMFWTAKESFVKYHGSLIKPYNEINFLINKTINDFNGGKIDDLYCYQSFFDGYSFSVVSDIFTSPEVIFITKEELKENK